MAITKILARRSGLAAGISYALNGDKTDGQILTAYLNCSSETAYRQMIATKERWGKTGGVQSYHIIQSFSPGEIEPQQALEIAKALASDHLSEFEAVIGVHADREHIHAHIVFNSVSCVDGHKYHSNAQSYYGQIRAISDRLCRENGLLVIMSGEPTKTVNYGEWLREQRGQPTYRAMLEADLREAIEDANDFGHFLMLMENMGYEVKHGKHLAFRLRGQEHFIRPGRKDEAFTEDGIRRAIERHFDAIEAGLSPLLTPKRAHTPYRHKTKRGGFLGLYAHYLYLLGKVEKRLYPPRMTPELKQELMRFERYKEQFELLQNNGIDSPDKLTAFTKSTEERIGALTKQRTILNVQKKKRKHLYDALADGEAYAPAKALYEDGVTGIETEFAKYMDAIKTLDESGVPRGTLATEKAKTLGEVAEVNRQLRGERKKLKLCGEIAEAVPRLEKNISHAEGTKKREIGRAEQLEI